VYHYIGLIWNPHDADASKSAALLTSRLDMNPNWILRLNLSGLAVYDRPRQIAEFNAYVLPKGCGIILGRLFPLTLDHWLPTWHANIGSDEALEIASTAGRKLIKSYWGSYVAFLMNPTNRLYYAIRDCSGKIPCFRTTAAEVEVIFSAISDLAFLRNHALTINWRYLASFISSNQLQVRETAINEISELLAGDCLVMDQGVRRQVSLWDPTKICANDIIESSTEALERLRVTTQQCISAWASVYGNVLHSLSGGFDSAVVLGCLSRAPSRPLVTCLNRFSDEPGGDERGFARMAAARAGVRLIERPWFEESRVLDERLLKMARTVKPTVPEIIGMLDAEVRNELAKEFKADSYWTGEGGDHLFFQMRSPIGVADYMYSHGFGPRLPFIIQDAARLAHVSYWSALCTGLEFRRGRARPAQEKALHYGGGLLADDVFPGNLLGCTAHPWTEGRTHIPAGKSDQIRYLAEVLNRDRPLPDSEYAPPHHPLLSQPLMEVCLRIPIYLLVRGGRQRGLARTAFRHAVPAEIVERESKGQTTAFVLGLLHQSLPFISGLLLDGLLVREGIISRKALVPYVSRTKPIEIQQLSPLLACVAAEVWARTWSSEVKCEA
jgi:asparagine synthase (glutamine-hydrolysing)